MGNCGVGFAPAEPSQHDWLISLMEGVEDIPGTALAEGIRWDWESFPAYLDAIERTPLAIDVGAQVPHGALQLRPPEMAYDLPASGKRLVQRADGYVMTLVAGDVVSEAGELTAARPGRLIRGPQERARMS
jgi:N-acyl-D-aspartate/D-glutamate deacylase